MKHLPIAFPLVTICGLALSSYGGNIVNNTWQDGTRTDPASPVYAENNGVVGVDADFDGDLESAYFASAGASLTVPAPGTLRSTVGSGSLFWTTYFTQPGTPVTLASAGDQIRVTWVFTLTGVNAINANQNLTLAVAQTPGARLATDASPSQQQYAGYSMFMNMGQTFGHASPFALKEWALVGNGNLLGTSANWGANGVANGTLANDGVNGNAGYADGIAYTYQLTLTRNGGGGLDILSTMTGGNLNGVGSLSISHTDPSPNSFTFDTFGVRPGTSSATASQFDTSLVRVEFNQIPEPTTFALAGLGIFGMAWAYRRVRR